MIYYSLYIFRPLAMNLSTYYVVFMKFVKKKTMMQLRPIGIKNIFTNVWWYYYYYYYYWYYQKDFLFFKFDMGLGILLILCFSG